MSKGHLSTETSEASQTRLGFVALALASLLVLGAAVVFVCSGVTTASARIAATTSNDSSLLTAATVDLVVDGGAEVASTGLLIDAAGLYPGIVVERCFEVTYWGSADVVPIRMFGQLGNGSGLESFINTTVEIGTGTQTSCGDFVPSSQLFDDTLADLWTRHASFDSGLTVIDAAQSGAGTWMRVTIEVIDDNDAQDLTTTFWLTLEARP